MDTVVKGTRTAERRTSKRATRCASLRNRTAAPAPNAAELVSAIAHELRTPLTSVGMTAEMLGECAGQIDAEEAQAMVARIQRGVAWMSGLVDNLAASAHGERIALRRERVDLGDLVREAASLAQPLLEQKQQRVRVNGPSRPVELNADPMRLRQVVLNLLVNANKYSTTGDVVDVTVGRAHGQAVVTVTDHGPGIDPAEQARIFSPYVRGAVGEAKARGLGLGLSIVKTIVERHGGRVGVESAPGAGATFLIAIPLEEK